MKVIEIPHNYDPRPYQQDFFKAMDSGLKRAVLVHHRRAGKDLMCFNFMIRQAIMKPDVYWYLFPLFTQARKAVWEGRTEGGVQYLSCIPKQLITNIRDDRMYIGLKNGSIIRFVGSDVDSLVGASPKGIVLSEYSLVAPDVWGKIEPMILEKNGWAVFNGTPRGSENHFYDMYKMAKKNPKWFCSLVSIKESNVLSEEQIQEIREEGTKTEEDIQQEYYCSFKGTMSGSYYADWINLLEEKGQITTLEYNPMLSTYTAWDLGMGDSTAIWIYQIDNSKQVRLIDYYESSGEGLEHYINVLRRKPYEYHAHYAPHDISVRELGTGKSRLEIAQEKGLRFRIVPKIPRQDGIEYVRTLFKRCWFDQKKCEQGIKGLRNYRKKYDEIRRCFSDAPLHDFSSHCFAGNTKLLTRYGMYEISKLPYSGEVLTLSGWKKYTNPRITRKNAPIVEVRFSDNTIVRCTPDHSFLTESGWRYAKDLEKGFVIRSSLKRRFSILKAFCTSCTGMNDTLHTSTVIDYIGMFGKTLLEKYRKVITYTTKTAIPLITSCIILSVLRKVSICALAGKKRMLIESSIFQSTLEDKRLYGMDHRKEKSGIANTQKSASHGRNGSVLKRLVRYVKSNIKLLSDQVTTIKNFVLITAKPLTIECVRKINHREDVWCITVPGYEHFSLSNGAVVHNCADAFRYLATSLRLHEEQDKKIQTRYIDNYYDNNLETIDENISTGLRNSNWLGNDT